jgi:hypothetical protein
MRKLATLVLLLLLPSCGSSPTQPPPPPTPPPAPAAAITATGAGVLVLHPSADSRFTFAMETPVRISETAGGAADWGFARMSFIKNGAEIERVELNANDIRARGYGRIAANSNTVYTVIFRFNSDDFDRIDITLGFSDAKDARAFTAAVPFNSFTDINFNFNPLNMKRSATPF